jgi:hypothetical protein
MMLKNVVFWDVALCSSGVGHKGSSLTDFSTLKMEVIRSSETAVHARSTWRHIPEDGILHSTIMFSLCMQLNFTVWLQVIGGSVFWWDI